MGGALESDRWTPWRRGEAGAGLRCYPGRGANRAHPLNSQYLAITLKNVVSATTASNSAVLRFLLTIWHYDQLGE